eukprot:TRINITY_DN32870_c0_g1_i1.p1 TRINITY_DN32870_c0_g1~~TRINITY_DN32870_c0_g1_i1.p1  ORF type:complete len:123 (-),score=18.42 TRINITY_DN32870_c0_g1_i1:152-520(-)
MAPVMLGFGQKQRYVSRIVKDSTTQREGLLETEESKIAKLNDENEKLVKELQESRRREAELLEELQHVLQRCMIAEEGEERLCSHLAELEAEFVEREIAFKREIQHFRDRLSQIDQKKACEV